MKKLITSSFAIAVALSINAQTAGYSSTGIYDDFATTDMYADPNPADPNNPDGIYWWGKDATGADPKDPNNTDPCVLNHKNTLTRSGNGKLGMSVSQGSECWQPFGISTKLDLSGNATFEVSITNNSSTAIYFDIYIADGNKNVINTNSAKQNFSLSSIAPGATKTLSGDFTGGFYKKWPGPTYEQKCDLSNITDISFTVVNADQPESNNYGPLPISNVSVTMNSIKMGNKASTSFSTNKSSGHYGLYPNPTHGGMVNFGSNQTNIKVFNAIGIEVLALASSSSMDVSGLSAGIYTVVTDEGAKKLLIQ